MTAIGNMRERVTIQSETRTPGDFGGYTQGWAAVATVWAQISPLKGRERVEAQAVEPVSPYRVKMRMRPDVLPAMRLLWRGKSLEIRSVYNADERLKILTLDCEEVRA